MPKRIFSFLKRQTLPNFLWMVFLWFGPIAVFTMGRFGWEINAVNQNIGAYLVYPTAASGICALVTAAVYLVMAPRKMVFPALIFSFDCAVIFSHFGDLLESKDFADFIKPQSSYIQKHCIPMEFIQGGKTYIFGMCDLVMDSTGQIYNFSFVYDTSDDIGNYDHLSESDKLTFVNAIRKYFKDDPNEQFENADFTADNYYGSFYKVNFEDEDAAGFVSEFGRPPQNSENPYPPMYW